MSRFRVPFREEVNTEMKTGWKEMFWCDYVGCVNYSNRSGIQNRNHIMVVDEDTHFCSSFCKIEAEVWDEKVRKEKEAAERPLAEK